jgi:hypothetical protein
MKNTTLIIFASLFTVLAPVQPMVLVAIIAIFIDTIFGVWRSVKKNGWTSFKSRRLSDTLGKAALYSGGIVFTFLIERFIAGDIIAHFIAVELIMTKFVHSKIKYISTIQLEVATLKQSADIGMGTLSVLQQLLWLVLMV